VVTVLGRGKGDVELTAALRNVQSQHRWRRRCPSPPVNATSTCSSPRDRAG
jgi:hypothetical protein